MYVICTLSEINLSELFYSVGYQNILCRGVRVVQLQWKGEQKSRPLIIPYWIRYYVLFKEICHFYV